MNCKATSIAGAPSPVDEFEQDCRGLLALLARDVEMCHSTDGLRTEGIDEHTPAPGTGDDRVRVRRLVSQAENNDVCLQRGWIEHHALTRGQAPSDELRILMILAQPLEVVIERVQARRRKDADLAHGATRHASISNTALDHAARAGQERAARCTETFRKGNRHEIEWRGERRERIARCNRGIPESRAIEIGRYSTLARSLADLCCRALREDHAACSIVGVLYFQQGRRRIDDVTAWFTRCDEFSGIEDSVGANLCKLHARIGR